MTQMKHIINALIVSDISVKVPLGPGRLHHGVDGESTE